MPVVGYFDFAIEDAKGNRSNVQLNFTDDNTGATLEDLYDVAQGVAQLIVTLITGRLLRAGVCLGVDVSGITQTGRPTADSDVEEGARFIWRSGAGGEWTTQVRIPTFSEDFMVSGSALVDITDPDVDAFLDFMSTGVVATTGTIQGTDYRGETIFSLSSARDAFTKSRKLR